MTEDLQLLIDAAKASGEIACGYFRDDPRVWDKDDNAGPVSEADLAVDRMLKDRLLSARASYGWLSEETEDSAERLKRDRSFIVDPIDGTRAFIAGKRSWSHSLAISEGDRIVAACVYLPMLDRLYTAAEGQPACLNGTPIQPSGKSDVKGASLLAAKPNFDQRNWKGAVPPFDRQFRPSLAYRLCLVAEGRFDAMLTLRECWEWDIAAGALIVQQARGRVSDRAAQPLRFNQPRPKTPGCLAAGRALHPLIQSQLAL